MSGREGPGPERPGPDYPPEWDTEPAEGREVTEFVRHEHGAWCHPSADGCPDEIPAPVMTDRERAIFARFEMAPAAPESYVQQHTSEPRCFCGPYRVGTLGVWTHRVVEP